MGIARSRFGRRLFRLRAKIPKAGRRDHSILHDLSYMFWQKGGGAVFRASASVSSSKTRVQSQNFCQTISTAADLADRTGAGPARCLKSASNGVSITRQLKTPNSMAASVATPSLRWTCTTYSLPVSTGAPKILIFATSLQCRLSEVMRASRTAKANGKGERSLGILVGRIPGS